MRTAIEDDNKVDDGGEMLIRESSMQYLQITWASGNTSYYNEVLRRIDEV